MNGTIFLEDTPTEGGSAPVAETEFREPEAGLQLAPREVTMPRAHQAAKLSACGIDPAVFGDVADPSFFIGVGIQAGIRGGISAQGNVNMLQKLISYRPAALDEVLLFRGEIESVEAVPRGQRVHTRVTFEDAQGQVVMDASRTSLRPLAARSSNGKGAGERPAPVVADTAAAVPLAHHELQPDQVKEYSLEGNSIHYDEAAAKAAGFRAPMVGGGMGVHYLLAALFARRAPEAFDLDVYFRRPIFWDEQFRSAVLGRPDDVTSWTAMCLLRDEHEKGLKVLTEARLNDLQF